MSGDPNQADVILVNPPYVQRRGGGSVAPIGLAYLAAALRRVGAEVAIVDLAYLMPGYKLDEMHRRRLREIVSSMLGDAGAVRLIGIGPLTTASLRSSRDICETARSVTRAHVVVGGPLCAVPDVSNVFQTFMHVDAFVAGDGEAPITSIWQDVVAGCDITQREGVGRPDLPTPRPYRESDLDGLALPARDLLPQVRPSARRSLGRGRTTSAFLSRGCPYSCTFCAAPLSSGRKVRRLSDARISDEIAACKALGIDSIIFYDDCLFIRSASLSEKVLRFCDAFVRAGWNGTFQLELRCDAVNAISADALDALGSVGCRQINMGIEKAHVAQLKQLRKRLFPEQAEQAVDRLVSSGIRAAGTFILGGDGETVDDLAATAEFACSLDLDFAHFNPLAVYPGTQLYSESMSQSTHWIEYCLDEELAPFGDILWRSPDLSLSSIIKGVDQAYSTFYATERLAKVLSRAPESERGELRESYRILAHERAHSWDTDTDPSASHCGAAA